MVNKNLIPHLFRNEYSKLVAVLSKSFGIEYIEIAEDIASETFELAFTSWSYKGVPENPTAWLYTVAKNKARNHYERNKLFREKIAEKLKTQSESYEEFEIDLSPQNIKDSQLLMLFAVCNTPISEESQISLALRILCGFGIEEIADAFMISKDTVNKRLQRAKTKLRLEKIKILELGEEQLVKQLETVLRTLYLLFSEGYYSESNNTTINKELCLEAMNLAYLLLNNISTNTHSSNSLMALMCFHSSRLEARISEQGEMILYQDQDETLWNTELIERGFYYLQQASKWEVTSKYYIEASIAYWHTMKTDSSEKWESILNLYNVLTTIDNSPIISLNRIYALSKVKGYNIAIEEAEKLNLDHNHFYFILLSNLYSPNDNYKAKLYLEKALAICKTDTEKVFIKRKIESL